jgi:hypothetical protein
MKIEVAKCKTCGDVFAAAKDYMCDVNWLKNKIKYLKTENVIFEVIEHPEWNLFSDMNNKCCGKKAKK